MPCQTIPESEFLRRSYIPCFEIIGIQPLPPTNLGRPPSKQNWHVQARRMFSPSLKFHKVSRSGISERRRTNYIGDFYSASLFYFPYRVETSGLQARTKEKPQFSIKPRDVQADEGQPARFECAVSGNPRPKVIWYVNGVQALHGHKYKLNYDGVHYLTISQSRSKL